MNPTKNEIEKVTRFLELKGIQFVASKSPAALDLSYVTIPRKSVASFALDPVEWWANREGVKPLTLELWNKWCISDYKCLKCGRYGTDKSDIIYDDVQLMLFERYKPAMLLKQLGWKDDYDSRKPAGFVADFDGVCENCLKKDFRFEFLFDGKWDKS